jgi:hypothetical protein
VLVTRAQGHPEAMDRADLIVQAAIAIAMAMAFFVIHR